MLLCTSVLATPTLSETNLIVAHGLIFFEYNHGHDMDALKSNTEKSRKWKEGEASTKEVTYAKAHPYSLSPVLSLPPSPVFDADPVLWLWQRIRRQEENPEHFEF